MPTYCFKCPKCGNTFEQLMTMGEYAMTPKPKCVEDGCDGHQTMQPQLYAVGFALKGTGWTPRFEGGAGLGVSTDVAIPKKAKKRGKSS